MGRRPDVASGLVDGHHFEIVGGSALGNRLRVVGEHDWLTVCAEQCRGFTFGTGFPAKANPFWSVFVQIRLETAIARVGGFRLLRSLLRLCDPDCCGRR